jgi:DNA-binding transcriptional MerR regulator
MVVHSIYCDQYQRRLTVEVTMVEDSITGPDNVFLLPVPGVRYSSQLKKGRARDAEAARLKALGWSLAEIAEKLNLVGDEPDHAEDRAAAAIKRAMASAVRFARDERRLLELEGLDELELRLWKLLDERQVLVQHGRIIEVDGVPLDDNRFALEVVDRIMKVKDQRCKLEGTYAPTRAEIVTFDSVEAEIARLEKQLRGVAS